MTPSELREMLTMGNVILIETGGELTQLSPSMIERPSAFEQQNGKIGVLGGWELLGPPTGLPISNAVAYDILNNPGYYVRLATDAGYVVAFAPAGV